jgi:DnaJ-class molecular chaperone
LQELCNKANFNGLLTNIKKAGLPEGGPSKGFITNKERILKANNAYDVLGVPRGAAKEVCIKAYKKNVIFMHTDKVPEIWQAQASELFSIMDAAYKYLSAL